MVTLFERHLLSLASFLMLVSAPLSAFSQTIIDSGHSRALTKVHQDGTTTIDVDDLVVNHSTPGSGDVSASGSESPPNTSNTTAGSLTAGLNQNVFSLHWTGESHTTTSTPIQAPFAGAHSHLCGGQTFSLLDCDRLVFTLSAPTPITLAASGTGTIAKSGPGGNSAGVFARTRLYDSSTVVVDEIDLGPGPGSDSFDRRFSAILSPGTYTFEYPAWAAPQEDWNGLAGINQDASASLDIVLTLSPTGDCSDGLDNDGDTLVDLDDSDCEDGTDTSEATPVPALSTAGRAIALTSLLLLTLHHLRTRRRA